ncbi:hypothetical protein Hsw_1773 [Hymenobacter swuensis DY53]|uniref:BON domain-containing protein n=2 Tax=Hymenobacter TaxID=89966 RepID=W8EXR4_9BACT|nr:hypothetical protein Hsw_1773 [Hymenobacter swuensis DY53]
MAATAGFVRRGTWGAFISSIQLVLIMPNAHLLSPPVPADSLADADITAAIEQLLSTKKGLVPDLITVATRQGIVQLSGSTDNLLARQRAEDIVQAVRGVRGLHSTLAVRPVVVAEAELQRDVAATLADDPATAHYHVSPTVSGGVVTLTGQVQSWAEKQLVLRVVQGVRGVRACLADQLTIKNGPILHSDEEITTQIRELLDWDIRVNGALVDVRTNDHVVHLSGTVGTAAEKDRLVAIANQTGATRVDARDLFVAYWALGKAIRREKFTLRTDEAIASAVRDTLRCNPRVRDTETLVQVHEGVVTLAGTVSNLRVRLEAEQDARHVVGVQQVHNLLKVRPARLVPDEDIRQTITAALARDPYVGQLPFGVQVHEGQVLLSGQAPGVLEQERAGDLAAGVSGVLDVNNRIQTDLTTPETTAPPIPTTPWPSASAPASSGRQPCTIRKSMCRSTTVGPH